MKLSKHFLSLLMVAFFITIGCERDDMWEQSRANTYGKNESLPNNQVAMTPPKETVARGQLNEDDHLMLGIEKGQVATSFPIRVTKELLLRGQGRYDIFCLPCHGQSGDGRGMIVERGFKQPDALFSDRLAAMPIGYFFGVMINGFETMQPGFVTPKDQDPNKPIDKVHPAIAKKIKPNDKWAIVAYIRALQFSRNVNINELSPDDREKINAGTTEKTDGK